MVFSKGDHNNTSCPMCSSRILPLPISNLEMESIDVFSFWISVSLCDWLNKESVIKVMLNNSEAKSWEEPCTYFVLLKPNLPCYEEGQAAQGEEVRLLASTTASHCECGYSKSKLSSLRAEQKQAPPNPDQMTVLRWLVTQPRENQDS